MGSFARCFCRRRRPTYPTVPRTGVHSRQLCRTVATGRTAGPAGGPCHLGLGTLPSSGRVTFTDKSDQTTTGHAPCLRSRPRRVEVHLPLKESKVSKLCSYLSRTDRVRMSRIRRHRKRTQMTWPTLTIQTTVARGPAGHRADDTLPLRTVNACTQHTSAAMGKGTSCPQHSSASASSASSEWP
jgi:hypothetical protein